MGAGRVPLWGGALKCMFEGKSRRDDSRGRVVKQGCGVGGWGVGVATDTKSIRLNLSLFVRFISYSAPHCDNDDYIIYFHKGTIKVTITEDFSELFQTVSICPDCTPFKNFPLQSSD